MTLLVIEDGTVYSSNDSPLVKPNSFVTEQEYIDFFTVRNDTVAAEGDSETICASLVWAWDYLGQEYRLRFVGSLVKAFQFATWPRRAVPVPDFFDPWFRQSGVPFEFRHTVFIDETTIPIEIKEAQILLARASQLSASTSESLQTSLGRVTRREKLGELEVEYAIGLEGQGQGNRQTTLYWDAQKRMEPFLRPVTGGIAVRS